MYQINFHNQGKEVESLDCDKCSFRLECEKYKDNSDVCKDNNSESEC